MNSQVVGSRPGSARDSSGESAAPALRLSSPREIEVHIEELVLHGFTARDRWQIGDALERELRELLAEKGIPPAWLASPERIDAGTARTSDDDSDATGAGIAEAVYRGGAK